MTARAHLTRLSSSSYVEGIRQGLEYIHAKREIQNGQSGTLNRVQAAAQYSF